METRRIMALVRFALGAALALGFVISFTGSASRADEGIWTFDNPPLKQLQERYGFTPTQAWLDHLRLSSIRFNDGGSGSFISPHGLALTNHHVAFGQLQKVSTPQKDYVKDGFYARTQAEELKCPDLELNVLVSMENATNRVQAAVKPDMSDKDALTARNGEIARIERGSLKATGLRSDVVTLYQGGEYWLYRYKRYTDVRLVFAPEQQAAFFGGDPDNFTYPRYDMDLAIFRAYENGKPAETPNYLKWDTQGAAAGDLVLVSGNPGSTSRLDTMAQLEDERDYYQPIALKRLHRQLEALQRYSAAGPEQARQAAQSIFILQNSIKVRTGMLEGLRDKALMAGRQKQETEFRSLVDQNPEWKKAYGPAWDEIATSEKEQTSRILQLRYRTLPRISHMASNALTIVQYVAEITKPDEKRLQGYHDSQLESLRFRLFSPAPVYPQLEGALLADSLEEELGVLGPNDAFIRVMLSGQSPQEAARRLVAGTKMADPAFRKSLVEGGEAAVEASSDPMIVMARKVDPIAREMRKWEEDHVESVETAAGEKIGKARFAAYGKALYPDATFTLRLSYGTVTGYPMNGTVAPPKTTFYGLYDRAASFDNKAPFDLPARYLERRAELDLSVPFNFVSTCDIIGGNSGSPVVNRAGELVGLIFDGNIESLVGDYVYNEATNRAVAVDTAAMTEALRKLYDAGALMDEIEGK